MNAVHNIHTHLNLNGNEVRNVRLEGLPSDPDPVEGGVYFNLETGEFRFSDGTAWKSLLGGFWKLDDDGNLVTDKTVIVPNLIARGDLSTEAKGSDPGAAGTILGITVNGFTYGEDYINAGILDLSEAFNNITVDLSGYASTDYVDNKIAGLINGAPSTLDTLKEIAFALAENADIVTALDAAIGSKADKATTLAGYGITDAYTKVNVDDLLKKYLLLEAENQTIKGNLKIEGNLIIAGDMSSEGTGGNSGADGTVIGVVVNGTSYADETNGMLDLSTLMNQYLSTAGGTLTASKREVLYLNTTAAYCDLTLQINKVDKAVLSYDATHGVYVYNCPSGKYIGVKDDGTPYYYNGSYKDTLIHSGNIGSQYVEGIGTIYADQSINFGAEGKIRLIKGVASTSTSLGFPNRYTSGISVLSNYCGWQMLTYGGAYINNPYFRKLNDNATWSDWKQLAFLTDNVASATKLQTARTIWGQSFDGTDGVLANSGVGLMSSKGYYYGLSILPMGNPYYGVRTFLTYDQGATMGAFEIASRNVYGLIISHGGGVEYDFSRIPSNLSYTSLVNIRPNGNVLIGTEVDAGYKLAANGGSAIYVGLTDTTTHAGLSKSNVFSVCYSGDNNFGLHTWVNSNGTALMQACYIGQYEGVFYKIALNPFGGNVGIGTNSPAYKLDVNGTTCVGTAGSGNELLRFNTDRPWAFYQVDSGGSASLALRSLENTKNFIIQNNKSEYIARFFADTNSSLVHIYTPLSVNGAVTMSSTLSVSGQTTINNNLIVAGDTSTGSDIRFKDKLSDHRIALSDIAEAPLFTFRWNDRDDKTEHLGSSAQYWEKVAPWLVKGEDFKTLDYSTLGVAIGISLANKAVNHEERIKILEDKVKALEAENRRLRYGS